MSEYNGNGNTGGTVFARRIFPGIVIEPTSSRCTKHGRMASHIAAHYARRPAIHDIDDHIAVVVDIEPAYSLARRIAEPERQDAFCRYFASCSFLVTRFIIIVITLANRQNLFFFFHSLLVLLTRDDRDIRFSTYSLSGGFLIRLLRTYIRLVSCLDILLYPIEGVFLFFGSCLDILLYPISATLSAALVRRYAVIRAALIPR